MVVRNNNIKDLDLRYERPSLWPKDNVVASHPAGPGSNSGRVSYLVEVFPGIFPNCTTNIRKFKPYLFPGTISPS